MELLTEFLEICRELNKVNITPTLMGSLGLEYVTQAEWQPSDIDIHVSGDARGWDAPTELRIYDWDKIVAIMTQLGYELADLHEHEFRKNGLSVEFGTIDTLDDFAGIKEQDIPIETVDDISFRVPTVQQFLKIYSSSSKDSYRNANNNYKDFAKIVWLKRWVGEREK